MVSRLYCVFARLCAAIKDSATLSIYLTRQSRFSRVDARLWAYANTQTDCSLSDCAKRTWRRRSPECKHLVPSLTTKVMKISDDKNYQGVCVISAALFKIATNFFLSIRSTVGASLACSFVVNSGEVNLAFPTYAYHNVDEVTPPSIIKRVYPKFLYA